MARIRIEEVIDELSSDMKKALEAAVLEVIPEADFDRNRLFHAFRRAVGRKCSTWETVKDQYVEKE